jgi:hypothetical protein
MRHFFIYAHRGLRQYTLKYQKTSGLYLQAQCKEKPTSSAHNEQHATMQMYNPPPLRPIPINVDNGGGLDDGTDRPYDYDYDEVSGNGDGSHRTKIGHVCCRCCCDTRRAVIIIKAVYSFLIVLDLVFGSKLVVKEGLDVLFLLCTVCGTMGAIRYQRYLIGVAVLPHAIDFVMVAVYPIQMWWMIPILAALVYPHVMLIQEINDGIMSKETYDREKASCCCVV